MSSASKAQAPYWRVPDWFSDLDSTTLAQLKLFHDELFKANKLYSLVPPKTIQAADQVHFADCILAGRIILASNPDIKSMYAFGSGGGFPGVVFAILFPKLNIEICETDLRKLEFLKHMAIRLKSSNLNIQAQSFDKLKPGVIENAVCRGFADISKTMYSLRTLVGKGGNVYNLKSDLWGLELSRVPTQLCSLWEPVLVKDYQLPLTIKTSAVVNLKKV